MSGKCAGVVSSNREGGIGGSMSEGYVPVAKNSRPKANSAGLIGPRAPLGCTDDGDTSGSAMLEGRPSVDSRDPERLRANLPESACPTEPERNRIVAVLPSCSGDAERG